MTARNLLVQRNTAARHRKLIVQSLSVGTETHWVAALVATGRRKAALTLLLRETGLGKR